MTVRGGGGGGGISFKIGSVQVQLLALVQMEVPNSLNRLYGLGPRVQSSTCSALSQVYASVSNKRQPGPVKMTKSAAPPPF